MAARLGVQCGGWLDGGREWLDRHGLGGEWLSGLYLGLEGAWLEGVWLDSRRGVERLLQPCFFRPPNNTIPQGPILEKRAHQNPSLIIQSLILLML